MIRLVARTNTPAHGETNWLVIEGDDRHGYLVRAFRELETPQISDDWVQDLDDTLAYGERIGIAREAWRGREEPLPGAQPFPDVGSWTPDNSQYE